MSYSISFVLMNNSVCLVYSRHFTLKMAIFADVFIGFLAIFTVYLALKKWRYYHLLWKLPSLKGRLISGNIFDIIRVRDDMEAVFQMVKPLESSSVICFWVFHLPYIFLTKHDSAEVILRSHQEIQKSGIYDLVHPWLGNGLLTSSGNRWRSHRKLLNPSFHFCILENFVPIFNEQSQTLVSLLSKHAGKGIFDVYPFISRCTLDIICETAMGKRMDTQLGKNSEYLKAVINVSETVMRRTMYPWLMIPWVFELSPSGRRQKKCLKILHGFTENVIQERRKEHKESQWQITQHEQTDEGNVNYVYGQKKRKALLDMLLETSYQGEKCLTDEMIKEETDTFMFAGHDTTAANITWVLFFLGWCPSVQETVHRELNRIFGNLERPVNLEDLNELKYLEAVIKESLRLIPSVPVYGRRINRDIDIGGYEIPSGAEVFIWTGMIGRDPNIYSNPNTFDPMRFFKDDFQKKHPYAYVPFSAGPRNCIGQKFAMMEEKVILANVLRTFEIKTHNDIRSIKAMSEIVYRPINGMHISLERKCGN